MVFFRVMAALKRTDFMIEDPAKGLGEDSDGLMAEKEGMVNVMEVLAIQRLQRVIVGRSRKLRLRGLAVWLVIL